MAETKLTIKADIPENTFIEGLLNMRHSGLDVMFPLVLYSMAHRWHIDKLTYYLKLVEDK